MPLKEDIQRKINAIRNEIAESGITPEHMGSVLSDLNERIDEKSVFHSIEIYSPGTTCAEGAIVAKDGILYLALRETSSVPTKDNADFQLICGNELEWDSAVEVEFTQEKYIANTGGIIASSYYRATEHYPVAEGDQVRYMGASAYNCLAGYSNAGTSGFVRLIGSSTSYIDKVVTIPAGVNYIVASYALSGLGTNTPSLKVMTPIRILVDRVGNSVAGIERSVGEVESACVNKMDWTLICEHIPFDNEGKYIANSGGLVSSSSFNATQVVVVEPGDKLRYRGRSGTYPCVCGYDSVTRSGARILKGASSTISDVVITIPYGVNAVACAYNIAQMEADSVGPCCEILRSSHKPYRIEPIDEYNFYMCQRQPDGSYTKTMFSRAYHRDAESGLVCKDAWFGGDLYHRKRGSVTDIPIGQTSLIVVLKLDSYGSFANENNFIGLGHGCCVAKWARFFVDGKIFDPSSLDAPMECNTFSLVQYVDYYAYDGTVSTTSELGVPKTDGDDIPVVAATLYQCVEFSNGEIVMDNDLTIKRDGTKFVRCYCGMSTGYYPYFSNVSINKNGIANSYAFSGSTPTVSSIGGSDVLTSMQSLEGDVSRVVQWGENYILDTELVITENATEANADWKFDSGRQCKVYINPCRVSRSPGGAREYNAGDHIRTKTIKRIKYNGL